MEIFLWCDHAGVTPNFPALLPFLRGIHDSYRFSEPNNYLISGPTMNVGTVLTLNHDSAAAGCDLSLGAPGLTRLLAVKVLHITVLSTLVWQTKQQN